MAQPKDKYYWTQLRTALTAGQWSTSFPARAVNGAALSWPELFRKFNKHCRGFEDVVEVASETQALASLLGAEHDETQGIDQGSYGLLSLGGDCLLPGERIDEANEAYGRLKKLESPNFDSLKLALAYYAYALGHPDECLSHLSEIPDFSAMSSRVPTTVSETTRSSGSALQVPSSGTDNSSSIWTGSFVSSESNGSMADIKDGKAWATIENVRSICLRGMSHEKLSPRDIETPLQAYRSAFTLLSAIESDIPRNLVPSGGGKLDLTSFTRYRELWRWVEQLLWRATVLAAKKCVFVHENCDQDVLWKALALYRTCSAYWPPTFRANHRSTVSVIHIRALVLRSRTIGANVKPSIYSLDPDKPPEWLSTARSVIQDYRSVLSVSTKFPKAGERNIKVEEFIDLCVAVWESSGAAGDHASWVIDILWWATRLTFNSYRIFRHMSQLFYVSGDTELAKRTLQLYVQVVGKVYETGGAGVDGDADTDKNWVETLVHGSRMLNRAALAVMGLDGIQDIREAGTLIEKARTRLDGNDKELSAKVDLAEGIWNLVMAHKEQDPHTRPNRLTQALSLLQQSVATHATPSGYYHLALALARPGPSQDLNQAINYVALAVEGAPKEIRHWHLLGLLLAASEQWKAATSVLEHGADVGDDLGGMNDDQEGSDTATSTGDDGVRVRDFGAQDGGSESNGQAGATNGSKHTSLEPAELRLLLDDDALRIPPAAGLLQPIPDHHTPSRQELFEQELQLQMTRVALAEYAEGPERAEDKWVDVFSWVADKKRNSASRPRSSVGTSIADITPPSEVAYRAESSLLGHVESRDFSAASTITPPITITPATPAANGQDRFPSNIYNPSGLLATRSLNEKRAVSMERDTSKGKKVQQMLKNRVHKEQARITTISKKIGNGVVRNGSVQLRRITSAPDFQTEFHHSHYQASSIHSRRRLGSIIRNRGATPPTSPPPPPPPPLPPMQATQPINNIQRSNRLERENRLLSDLWLMSAATFRRLGKIEQAKGAIQEAEVKDENNPNVWVQLGLYYMANRRDQHAIDAFHKALFISLDDVSATIHLCRLYLSPTKQPHSKPAVNTDNVDLAAGMLDHLTRGPGWDVPEAWYFLAKAYGMQSRKDRERECLAFALRLSERRGVRDIGTAVGWCL